MHITHLTSAVVAFKPNEKRDRKLLLHKKQILKLRQQTMQLGYTITALSCYANEKNKFN
jgi:SsrA-binding protein